MTNENDARLVSMLAPIREQWASDAAVAYIGLSGLMCCCSAFPACIGNQCLLRVTALYPKAAGSGDQQAIERLAPRCRRSCQCSQQWYGRVNANGMHVHK